MDKAKNIATPFAMPLVLLYFFFNGVGLPEGLTYTFLLTPLFIYLNWKEGIYRPYLYFLAFSLIFFLLHYCLGIELGAYLRSWLLFFSAFVFVWMVFLFCRNPDQMAPAFKNILLVNSLLLPVAAIALFTPLRDSFWYTVPISPGLPLIPRLKMLTYEASYYSLLLVPVFFYYYLKLIFVRGYRVWLIALLLGIPLLASFSLGILGGLFLSLLIMYLGHIKWLVFHRRFKNTFLILTSLFLVALVALYWYFPDNPLFARLKNIPDGTDTSARGRTYEALELAWLMAKEKSIWFGIGLGQVKILGRDIIIHYYQYLSIPEVVRLPNAVAETLAQFGIVGLIIRFGLQIYLFFTRRVWSNFFRLSIFLFVFIYQFTGSFMVNLAELSLWVMAFMPVVPELDKSRLIREMKIPLNRYEKGGTHD